MSGGVYQNCFDPADAANAADYSTVGSYLLDASNNVITSTLVGSDQALDVNVVATSGQFAEDTPHTSGDLGTHAMAVRQDTLASSTSADGDYGSLKATSTGELYVHDADAIALLTTIDTDTGTIVTNTGTIAGDTTSIDATLTALSKAEDSAHVSGDQGIMALAVRDDAGGSLVSADGDYTPLSINNSGELRVAGSFSTSCPNSSIVNTATTVNNTATDLVGTDLANRQDVWVANRGNRPVFIGGSGVTAANGYPLPRGSFMNICAGANIDLHGITASGTADVRILELA